MTYFRILFILVVFTVSDLLSIQAQSTTVPPFSNEILKERTFNYFWKLADPTFGQVPDRYPSLTFSSIAATGFGLTSYIVGAENKYITRAAAAERTLKTLKALYNLKQGAQPSGVSARSSRHIIRMQGISRWKIQAQILNLIRPSSITPTPT
jgi:hypothetical protein